MIRDLLYFDFDKAASLQSQTTDGLKRTIAVSEDSGKTREASTSLSVAGIGGASLGVDYVQKRSTLESRVLHHNLLTDLEKTLEADDLVLDLVTWEPEAPLTAETVRAAVGQRPYVHAVGSAVIEDYGRMLKILDNFNGLSAFVGRSAENNTKNSPQYQAAVAQLADREAKVKSIADRNERSRAQRELNEAKRQLDQLVSSELTGVADWIVQGLHSWIEIFMKDRINLRIRPYAECNFELICNLKQSCFVDDDIEHLLYGYGKRPTVPLVVLGLVTSMPLRESSNEGALEDAPATNKEQLERSYQRMFLHLDELESFSRFDRFPNVMVHPIAVYRDFEHRGLRQ